MGDIPFCSFPCVLSSSERERRTIGIIHTLVNAVHLFTDGERRKSVVADRVYRLDVTMFSTALRATTLIRWDL